MNPSNRQFLMMRLAALAVMTAGSAALADMQKFELARSVPTSAFMVVQSRDHEGQAFIRAQMKRVWEVVAKQRFDRDLQKLLKATMNPPTADPAESQPSTNDEAFEKHWQQVMDLAAGVQWSTLGQNEYCFAMAMSFPTVEFCSMMRPPADRVEQDFAGLEAIVKSLAELDSEQIVHAVDGSGESVVHSLSMAGSPFPMVLTLARHKQTILVGLGSSFIEQTLTLLRSGEGESIAQSERFKSAFKSLPAPVDGFAFVDTAKLFSQVRTVVDQAMSMAGGAMGDDPAGAEQLKQAKSLVAKFLDGADMFEYTATVMATEGMKTKAHSEALLREDAAQRLFYELLLGNPPVEQPLKLVPAGASDVWVTAGIQPVKFYDLIINMLKNDIPDGGEALATWEAMQEQWGLNIREEVLSWMQGAMISFQTPGKSQWSAGEFFCQLKVSDEGKARTALDRLFESVRPMLEANHGKISDAVVEGASGFRSVKHQYLAQFAKNLTLGVHNGWLVIGSSPEIIVRAFATAGGSEANMQSDERLRAQSVEVPDAVLSYSFADQSSLGEEIGMAMGLIAFGVRSAASGEIAKNPGLDFALTVLGKGGTVARAVNFLDSSSSVSTRAGNKIVSKSLQNFREPPKPRTRESSEGGESSGG